MTKNQKSQLSELIKKFQGYVDERAKDQISRLDLAPALKETSKELLIKKNQQTSETDNESSGSIQIHKPIIQTAKIEILSTNADDDMKIYLQDVLSKILTGVEILNNTQKNLIEEMLAELKTQSEKHKKALEDQTTAHEESKARQAEAMKALEAKLEEHKKALEAQKKAHEESQDAQAKVIQQNNELQLKAIKDLLSSMKNIMTQEQNAHAKGMKELQEEHKRQIAALVHQNQELIQSIKAIASNTPEPKLAQYAADPNQYNTIEALRKRIEDLEEKQKKSQKTPNNREPNADDKEIAKLRKTIEELKKKISTISNNQQINNSHQSSQLAANSDKLTASIKEGGSTQEYCQDVFNNPDTISTHSPVKGGKVEINGVRIETDANGNTTSIKGLKPGQRICKKFKGDDGKSMVFEGREDGGVNLYITHNSNPTQDIMVVYKEAKDPVAFLRTKTDGFLEDEGKYRIKVNNQSIDNLFKIGAVDRKMQIGVGATSEIQDHAASKNKGNKHEVIAAAFVRNGIGRRSSSAARRR